MPFEEIDIIETSAASGKKTGIAAGLTKMRGAPALLRFTLAPSVLDSAGFAAEDRFKALLGDGEDWGMIRLQKNKSGMIRLDARHAMGGTLYYMCSLKHRPEFVDRTEKAQPCQWEKIDLATIEIVLPAWADETNPHRKPKIKAEPPELGAARREAERLAQEAREAQARREEREREDMKDAMREVVAEALGNEDAEALRDILKFTKTEKQVLAILCRSPGRVVSRDSMATLLYSADSDDPPDPKIIDVYITKIRNKLPPSVSVKTVHGEGWKVTGEIRDLYEERATQ